MTEPVCYRCYVDRRISTACLCTAYGPMPSPERFLERLSLSQFNNEYGQDPDKVITGFRSCIFYSGFYRAQPASIQNSFDYLWRYEKTMFYALTVLNIHLRCLWYSLQNAVVMELET